MKLNIVVWNHKYGSDAWPVFANSKPKIGEIEQGLRDSGDWTESDDDRPDTYLDVYGPFDFPTQETNAVSVSVGPWKIWVERKRDGG